MSNEPTDNDEFLSSTYREISKETTPGPLDDAVLRMAADDMHSRGNPFLSRWSQPLAWAASVGLVIAIVLDTEQVAETPATSVNSAAPSAARIEEAFSADENDVVQEAEEMSRLRNAQDQPSQLSAPLHLKSAKAERNDIATCNELQRSQAQSWHDCVITLRKLGLDEEAGRQLHELGEAFPEFIPDK